MGPEVLKNPESYSAASDIWSLGCVTIFYMRGEKHVFTCKDDVLNFQPDPSGNVIFDNEVFFIWSSACCRKDAFTFLAVN